MPENKYESGYLLVLCNVEENELDTVPEVAAIPLNQMTRLTRLVAAGTVLFGQADELTGESNILGKIGFSDFTPKFYTGVEDIASTEIYDALMQSRAIIVSDIPAGLEPESVEGTYLVIYGYEKEKIRWQTVIKHTNIGLSTHAFDPRNHVWTD